MKSILEYVYSWNDCPIQEMASISKHVKFGKGAYRVEIHGPASKDRETPHIHIYRADDSHPWTKFNFEVSLVDIIRHDEINLVRMKDIVSRKNITNRSKCSWDGYSKMRNDFEDWLYSENVEIKGDYIDNLDALLYWYNQQSNSSNNALLDYFKERGYKVHKNYHKYFNWLEKEVYKELF